MKMGEKLRYLRQVEGTLRGLGREMTQQEVVRAIKREVKSSFSQAYLSQIENGVRPHLTNSTRMLLARFFKVHPGYLVDDPEGYHTELVSDVRTLEDQLDLWLIEGAERFRRDSGLRHALLAVSMHADSRRCLILMKYILDTPGLADRLFQVLRPERVNGRASSPAESAQAAKPNSTDSAAHSESVARESNNAAQATGRGSGRKPNSTDLAARGESVARESQSAQTAGRGAERKPESTDSAAHSESVARRSRKRRTRL